MHVSGPLLIDVSAPGRHVKFTEGESVDSTSLDPDSEDIVSVEREIALQVLSDMY